VVGFAGVMAGGDGTLLGVAGSSALAGAFGVLAIRATDGERAGVPVTA
jgi:hypothetical protein